MTSDLRRNLSAAPALETAPQVDILLVDDRWENLLALEASLGDLKQNLVMARSGEEALKCVLDRDFAVILLDVVMPGLDGFETASLIRERERSRFTPIIFITAVNDASDHMVRGYSVGAVDYIYKPISPEVLKSKVAVFVELFNKTRQLESQGEALLRLKEMEHAARLDEVETHHKRFFSLSLELMGVLGFDGRLKELNHAWQRTLGHSEAELRSRPLTDFVHPDDGPAVADRLYGDVADDEPWSLECRVRCADGGLRWLAWNGITFPVEGLHYVVARDVTESKRALTALSDHAAHLARSNAELEQFAFIASHDLKEPLRTVVSFLQLLEKKYGEGLHPEAQECIAYAVGGARRMHSLVNDLLSYSRQGGGYAAPQSVDCNEVLAAVLRNLQQSIEESGAEVRADVLPTITAHAGQLVLVFQNLLANALKYRRDVPPRIDIAAGRQDGSWVFSVRDNGIGIPAQHHERIFRIFQRLHDRQEYEGTGIGLAVVKKIVEHNGGRVWLHSTPGEGSTFYFSVPPVPIQISSSALGRAGAPG